MSFMSSLFGGKSKTPAPLPELPNRNDKEIEDARKKAIVDARIRAGRSSTNLTSRSVRTTTDTSPGTRSATLLGE